MLPRLRLIRGEWTLLVNRNSRIGGMAMHHEPEKWSLILDSTINPDVIQQMKTSLRTEKLYDISQRSPKHLCGYRRLDGRQTIGPMKKSGKCLLEVKFRLCPPSKHSSAEPNFLLSIPLLTVVPG